MTLIWAMNDFFDRAAFELGDDRDEADVMVIVFAQAVFDGDDRAIEIFGGDEGVGLPGVDFKMAGVGIFDAEFATSIDNGTDFARDFWGNAAAGTIASIIECIGCRDATVAVGIAIGGVFGRWGEFGLGKRAVAVIWSLVANPVVFFD